MGVCDVAAPTIPHSKGTKIWWVLGKIFSVFVYSYRYSALARLCGGNADLCTGSRRFSVRHRVTLNNNLRFYTVFMPAHRFHCCNNLHCALRLLSGCLRRMGGLRTSNVSILRMLAGRSTTSILGRGTTALLTVRRNNTVSNDLRTLHYLCTLNIHTVALA